MNDTVSTQFLRHLTAIIQRIHGDDVTPVIGLHHLQHQASHQSLSEDDDRVGWTDPFEIYPSHCAGCERVIGGPIEVDIVRECNHP